MSEQENLVEASWIQYCHNSRTDRFDVVQKRIWLAGALAGFSISFQDAAARWKEIQAANDRMTESGGRMLRQFQEMYRQVQ